MADETVRNEREAESIIGKSVLAGVPRIFTRQQRTIQNLRNAAALAITIVIASGVGYFLSGFAKRFL